ncbi:hypothetical protein MC378_07715 [Polaribacter sp. MSW13]|uniref:Uncharacterized protein n=1 Tax=Polaribacter marinus TaxID=2916838 RepID=A0A9X2AL98_9FLAO|nr:hypothetical protein [Polaribacter marinus]MCI2229050.1 hypothetical protein [Polaribacter marinus]
MNKLWKLFQYGYLIVAVFFFIEAIISWSTDREKSYLFLGFSIFITLVFFFKRHFRKKIEIRNNQNK